MAESHNDTENVCKVCLKGISPDEVQRQCKECRNLVHFDCCETFDHEEDERVCFLCLGPELEEAQENLVETQEKHGKSTYILYS